MIFVVRVFLFPFSLLYGGAVFLRNLLYDRKWIPSRSFSTPVIGVGNLTAGGTGKTPHVAFFIRMFQREGFQVATLSRGYGRSTTGFRVAEASARAEETGDEPAMLAARFPGVTVAVCEDRAEGIRRLQKEGSPAIILLDDAYQHRKVKPGFSVLLIDYRTLHGPKFLLPAGRWREPFYEKRRADAIVVTKVPGAMKQEERKTIISRLGATCPVYFSMIKYGLPVQAEEPFGRGILKNSTRILLFTGIASARPLAEYIRANAVLEKHFEFGDHHVFTASEIEKVEKAWKEIKSDDKLLLTTEKDAARLKGRSINGIPLYYIPIEIALLDEGEAQIRKQFQERFGI